jgi:hypothetical protein
MPAFRYRLLDSDGSDLGPFVSSHPHWEPGRLIRHVGGYLRIVAVVEPETEEKFRACLVVLPFDSSN